MDNNPLTVIALLLSSTLQIYGLCRTATFRMRETAPGSLLYEIDDPRGWRRIRGPVYISTGTVIQVASGITAMLL